MIDTIKQTWWDKEIKDQFDDFESWVGSSKAYSKMWARKRVIKSKYKSIVDVGCGNATEYFAYKTEAPEIEYLGVDSSVFLNELNTSKGVPMKRADAHETGLPNSSYDLAFSRHVLEHQKNFRPILDELIRIGSKEAWHIFFIRPRNEEIINYNEELNLYHNTYKRSEIEAYVNANPKVLNCYWVKITDIEEALICDLKV